MQIRLSLTNFLCCAGPHCMCPVAFKFTGAHYPGIQFRVPCTLQDNFSWVPTCSLGPPECETELSEKNVGMGYVKMHGFHGNP